MKTFSIILILFFSSDLWASKPGGGRRERKTMEMRSSTTEIFRNFNGRISVILNSRINLRVPERMTSQQAEKFQKEAESLMENVKMESRKPSFETKREDIISILQSMNMGFATRANLLDFIQKNQGTSDVNMQGILSKAQELVDIIDNSFNILKSKVNDSTNSPVDGTKIADVLSVFGRVNGEFSARMVMDIVRRIESRIDNPQITLRKIAFCR